MNLPKNKRGPFTELILIPLIFLFIFLFISSSFNSATDQNKADTLLNKANRFLPLLSQKYATQVTNTLAQDSTYIYSVGLYDDSVQRRLVLINENPSQREFQNRIIVNVYPKNVDQYKHASNFDGDGFLDYTSIDKPVMHHYDSSNYSVLEVALPYINIDKIFIKQPGIWKQTLMTPFPDTKPDEKVDYEVSLQALYTPLFIKVLQSYDIAHLSYKTPKAINTISLSDYVKNEKKAIGKVEDSDAFWSSLFSKNSNYESLITFLGDKQSQASDFLKKISEGEQTFSEIFDIDKLATYYALINLFSNNEAREIGLLYNPETKLLEPLYLNTNHLGVLNTYVKDEKIDHLLFFEAYLKKLQEISEIDLKKLLQSDPDLPDRIKRFNYVNPEILFDSKVLSHNQHVIKKGINSSITIKAEFLSMDEKRFSVSIENLTIFPVEILGLNYRKKKTISTYEKQKIILKDETDKVVFRLPRSFENLFVHKKNKSAGFDFAKNIFDLRIAYKTLGLDSICYAEIVPYQPLENYYKDEDLFRREVDISKTDFVTVSASNKTIDFDSSFTLNSPLILPENYTVTAKPGVTINIVHGGKIISHSPLNFIGEKDNPIRIISKDKQGQGLLVLAEGRASTLKHVHFDGLTNPSHGMWSTTSAITFYESPVSFDCVIISNNTCEDAVNVVRTNFLMTNTFFKNTQSDAFDGDFVTGKISSCVFTDLGNDAIDVSGSDLDIYDVKIFRAGDKGLSAGEDSRIEAQKIQISNSEIAVAGKDLSTIKLKDIFIKDTKLGFTAFQKKSEFGPSEITVNQINMDSVEIKYLIEKASSLSMDGEKVKTEQNVKNRMYGVEFGRSSAETRERQQ
ncbi:hypothetical protein QQ020_26530 [Fulvivirgaceae bacterium BMA12]|uniref:Uncharacterized protein n=1 Tax=Agaribacillus aureus TaxID=3051825 RepID=A0ABT8LD19_9BACT|nr:hypothetical protein [Fulvivirgaceae bacterium BMA12]